MHLSQKDFMKFQSGSMTTEETIHFLQHLDQCNYCLEQMLQQEIPETASIAPAYLKDEILTRAQASNIKIKRVTSRTAHKLKLFHEGIRTVAGVALALVMLFQLGQGIQFTPSTPKPVRSFRETQTVLQSFSCGITDGMASNSQKLIERITFFSNIITNGGN